MYGGELRFKRSVGQTLDWSGSVWGTKLCSCMMTPWGVVKCLPNGCDEVAKNCSLDFGGIIKSTMYQIKERSCSPVPGGGLGRATWMANGLEAITWNSLRMYRFSPERVRHVTAWVCLLQMLRFGT